jgi:dipeptidase E
VLIPNALDAEQHAERRDETIRREIKAMKELGFWIETLDLREFFGEGKQLRKKLEDVGFVWTIGGNVFVLRRAMQESTLDAILIYNMQERHFVYGGYSAGACVAGPSLHGLDLVDDPEAVPDGYPRQIVWDGLGLVDFCIAPHYRSDHPESALIDKTVAYWEKHHMTFRALKDGEVIIVE